MTREGETYTIEEIREEARRATIAVVLAGVAWGTYGVSSLAALKRGDEPGLQVQALWHVPLVILFVVAIVAAVLKWVEWFDTVHAAVEPFGVVRERGGWSLWGWVVPPVNLVVPKRMVNDVWWTPDGGERTRLPWQVQVWWGLWVGALLSDSSMLSIEGTSAEVLSAFGSLLVGLSTPFAVWTIKLLTERVVQLQAATNETESVAA